MFRKVKAEYADLLDVRAKLLELPYRGADLSMVGLLPDLFGIRDRRSGAILFLWRLVDPAA